MIVFPSNNLSKYFTGKSKESAQSVTTDTRSRNTSDCSKNSLQSDLSTRQYAAEIDALFNNMKESSDQCPASSSTGGLEGYSMTYYWC